MKIRLVEPPSPSLHLWSYSLYPRLGLPLIGAALRDAGHDVRIYCPKLAPIDQDDLAGADLVGFSTTTSTAPDAYAMGDALRARGVPVVIGGSHVTFMADEALGHADFVARGEGGDALMLELVDALEGRRGLETIAGLSYTSAGRPVHNEDARALRGPRLAAGARPLADRRSRAPEDDPHHDKLGLPVRLHFLFGDGHVRPLVPLAQPGERDRRAQGEAAGQHLLLRRQPGGRQAALKTLLRMMIDEGLVIPGKPRCVPTWRATTSSST